MQSKRALGKHLPAWAVALLLGVVTLAVYWPATRFQFTDYDDPVFITANPHVRVGLTTESFKWAWTSQINGNWHPITMLSLILDCQLFGVSPWWPHLENVLLHAANAILLFALFMRMTRAPWRSAAVAALFALHPLHVESVAWVSERKDVLSTWFWLLTLWAYVRYAENLKSQVSHSRFFYGLGLLFFALGLFSKAMLVTLPFTLLLLDFWPLGRIKEGWSLLTEKMPHFALSAVFCVVTFHVQKQAGAVLLLQQWPLSLRAANALISYAGYIEKTFYPRHLAALYTMRSTPWPWWILALVTLALAGVSAGVLTQWRRRPFLAMGWFWYLGTLLPVIGIVQVGLQAMADRYTYVPLIGLFVMLVWGGWDLAAAWKLPAIVIILTVCALGICTALTVRQEYYWQDGEAPYVRMIEVASNNFIAYNNLGHVLNQKGRTDDAIRAFKKSILLNPKFAEAHNNLGAALEEKGLPDDAIQEYRQAIRLKPDLTLGHSNLGAALAKKGILEEAITQYQEAIRLKPDFVEARNDLGILFQRVGRLDASLREFQEAIRLKPDYVEAHNNLGTLFQRMGRLDEAISQYRQTLLLKPDLAETHYNLGLALNSKGRLDDAIHEYREAVRLIPDFFQARKNLGDALEAMGRFDEAMAQYREALRLKPGDTDTLNKLDRASKRIR